MVGEKILQEIKTTRTWLRGKHVIRDDIIRPVEQRFKQENCYDPFSYFSKEDYKQSIFMQFAQVKLESPESILHFLNRFGILGVFIFNQELLPSQQSKIKTTEPFFEHIDDFKKEQRLFVLFLQLVTALRKNNTRKAVMIFKKNHALLLSEAKVQGIRKAREILKKRNQDITALASQLGPVIANNLLRRSMAGVSPRFDISGGSVENRWQFSSLLSALYLMAFLTLDETPSFGVEECPNCHTIFEKTDSTPFKIYCSIKCNWAANKRKQRKKANIRRR